MLLLRIYYCFNLVIFVAHYCVYFVIILTKTKRYIQYKKTTIN